MTQNKKIWFFVEGECEKIFVLWLIRKFYPDIKVYNSESEFVRSDTEDSCFITDCESGDKIPFAINETYYKIIPIQCDIIIVCDLEKSPCVTQRKSQILNKLDNEVEQNLIRFVFSKPLIEDIYCSEINATKKVLEAHLKANGLSSDIPTKLKSLKERKGSPLETMKKLYRENKLTFKKTEFAHKFFSQFEYKKSINETVQRLVNFADAIFNDAIEK